MWLPENYFILKLHLISDSLTLLQKQISLSPNPFFEHHAFLKKIKIKKEFCVLLGYAFTLQT